MPCLSDKLQHEARNLSKDLLSLRHTLLMYPHHTSCHHNTKMEDKPPFTATSCHVPYRHVTPELTTCLLVCTSCPDTSRTHSATRGMSGPLQKNLCIDYALEHEPAAVGYRFLFGSTSDNTSCPFLSICLCNILPYDLHSLSLWTCSRLRCFLLYLQLDYRLQFLFCLISFPK